MIGNHFLTEGQIEALRPRVTFTLANIWRIERPDGAVQRFASHDKWIRFRGEDYRPIGPSASDMEQGEAGAESDFEIIGFLSSETIRASDIAAGRYDGASITHHVIDWQRPWMWMRKHRWWVREVVEIGGVFQAQVQGVERFLTIQAGRNYERECDKTLGSEECGATPIVTTGCVVEAVATPAAPILGLPHKTLAFSITAASWPTVPRDGLVATGKVVWVTGPNKGVASVVGEHVGRDLALSLRTPFPIRAGDVCDVWSGCDGSQSTCIDDYANGINHGGQPLMPSTEDTYRRPAEQ